MTSQKSKRSEPAELAYEVCSGILSIISNQMDLCEESDNPWLARYRFDAVKPFVTMMDDQIENLENPAERQTCRRQYDQIIAKGRRMEPTIDLICIACGDPFKNQNADDEDDDDDAREVCPACRLQASGA